MRGLTRRTSPLLLLFPILRLFVVTQVQHARSTAQHSTSAGHSLMWGSFLQTVSGRPEGWLLLTQCRSDRTSHSKWGPSGQPLLAHDALFDYPVANLPALRCEDLVQSRLADEGLYPRSTVEVLGLQQASELKWSQPPSSDLSEGGTRRRGEVGAWQGTFVWMCAVTRSNTQHETTQGPLHVACSPSLSS